MFGPVRLCWALYGPPSGPIVGRIGCARTTIGRRGHRPTAAGRRDDSSRGRDLRVEGGGGDDMRVIVPRVVDELRRAARGPAVPRCAQVPGRIRTVPSDLEQLRKSLTVLQASGDLLRGDDVVERCEHDGEIADLVAHRPLQQVAVVVSPTVPVAKVDQDIERVQRRSSKSTTRTRSVSRRPAARAAASHLHPSSCRLSGGRRAHEAQPRPARVLHGRARYAVDVGGATLGSVGPRGEATDEDVRDPVRVQDGEDPIGIEVVSVRRHGRRRDQR